MKFSRTVGGVHIELDTKILDDSARKAQIALNRRIAGDCEPLVPFSQGALRSSVNFPEGNAGGVIEWNTPYAHYQYMGEVYGPNIPKFDSNGNLTGYWSPPKKEPTGKPISYHHPGTTDHWFEIAKTRHLAEWEKTVRDEVRKGLS